MNFSIEARSIKRLMAWRTAGSLNSGCLVLRLARSPSTSAAGSVTLSSMKSTAPVSIMLTFPFAGTFQLEQDFVFHQHVIAIIIFAGLQHRARRRHRVAAALDFQRIEMRSGGNVVV